MPMYEYQCEAHGVFEAVRSLHEAALPEPCPDCGDHAARILSAPVATYSRNKADQLAAVENGQITGHVIKPR